MLSAFTFPISLRSQDHKTQKIFIKITLSFNSLPQVSIFTQPFSVQLYLSNRPKLSSKTSEYPDIYPSITLISFKLHPFNSKKFNLQSSSPPPPFSNALLVTHCSFRFLSLSFHLPFSDVYTLFLLFLSNFQHSIPQESRIASACCLSHCFLHLESRPSSFQFKKRG